MCIRDSTYDMKIETLKKVKAEGMYACSGGIIGMGETWEDRLDMACLLYTSFTKYSMTGRSNHIDSMQYYRKGADGVIAITTDKLYQVKQRIENGDVYKRQQLC